MQRRRIEALKDEKFKCKGKQHSWYGEVRPVLQDGATEDRNYKHVRQENWVQSFGLYVANHTVLSDN